jgi:sec-independent protein translocase protein TatA
MSLGPVELILILVIVVMLFGVGKMPELFGAVGKGVREFRKASQDETTPTQPGQPAQPPTTPTDTTTPKA